MSSVGKALLPRRGEETCIIGPGRQKNVKNEDRHKEVSIIAQVWGEVISRVHQTRMRKLDALKKVWIRIWRRQDGRLKKRTETTAQYWWTGYLCGRKNVRFTTFSRMLKWARFVMCDWSVISGAGNPKGKFFTFHWNILWGVDAHTYLYVKIRNTFKKVPNNFPQLVVKNWRSIHTHQKTTFV